MKYITFAAILGAVSAASSFAGGCPAGGDPNQIFLQSPWAFQLTNSTNSRLTPATVGTFKGQAGGVLLVTATTQNGGTITRDAQIQGRYLLYPDCTGGELLFSLGGKGLQLEFVYDKGFTEMFLVPDTPALPVGIFQPVMTGFAHRAPAGCPAGLTSGLDLLNGMKYAFRTYTGTANGSESAGTLTASVVNGAGVLSGVETEFGAGNTPGGPARDFTIGGRYQVYSDCSGGELIITGRPASAGQLQLEFVFSRPDFSEILFINDSWTVNAFGTNPVAGQGRKITGVCPADPAQVLQSSPWAFQLTGDNNNQSTNQALGTFRALPGGMLQITATTQTSAGIARDGQYSGRYILYPDCAGGELMFMINSQPVQLEFVYTDQFNEMYLVTDSASSSAGIEGGVARRAPSACPAGINPLNLLAGNMWSFRTYEPFALTPDRSGAASIGMITPLLNNGVATLTGAETANNGSGSNGGSVVTRLAALGGRYQVYPDCSGGELLLTNRAPGLGVLQLEFVFSSRTFDEILFLNDAPMQITSASFAAGEAKIF